MVPDAIASRAHGCRAEGADPDARGDEADRRGHESGVAIGKSSWVSVATPTTTRIDASRTEYEGYLRFGLTFGT